MTFEKATEALGVGSQSSVYDWENGISLPNPETISQIEGATDGLVTFFDHFTAWCLAHKGLRRERLAAGRRAAKEWEDAHG